LFSYKVSAYYSLEHDTGIRFDDPTLAIDWGVPADAVTVSEKDRDLHLFEPDSFYFA
jgi:dTDP-4-dehydrorhamnose 3,5-epimerase